jgi:dihydroflavonol-4-reductase
MAVCISHVLNVVDVRDVAAGIVTALQAERYGESILLSGHNIPSDVLFSWICQIGGARPPRFSVPASLGLLASYGIESFLALFGQRSPMPSLAAMLTCEMEWMAPSAAQRALGITARPLSATLQDAVAWYRTLGYC